ncbi:molybdopterin-binding protein [Bacteroidota bacterium]
MNCLKGHIIDIQSKEHLSLVWIQIGLVEFKSIVIDTPDTSDYLKVGNVVKVLFKESETILARNLKGDISLQNRIEGMVTSVDKGHLLSNVHLDCNDNRISSVITSLSVERLGIQKGVKVTALIKTNEVVLAPEHGT